MFNSLYSAIKEPFDAADDQSAFFKEQQNLYQQKRILPNQIPGAVPFVQANLNTAKDALRMSDPYTGKASVPFNDSILGTMLQGSPAQSPRVEECRRYTGLSGLEQMILDTSANPNAPLRCGLRYKKSSGLVPEVAQGAYGTPQGPLMNTVDSPDALGNGVVWFWDLQKAKKQLLKDACASLTTCTSLMTLPSIQNGTFVGKIGFCKTSQKFIPITNAFGQLKAAYPDDPTLDCTSSQIATTVGQCTMNEGFVDTSELDATCLQAGGGTLSRDCLLRAVQMAGCSDKGTMYTALQSAAPAGPYDTTLKTKKSYQDYQSQQGSAAITQSLFRADQGSMNLALSEVGKIRSAIQSSPSKAIRTAADDLCTRAGIYDTYDFCSDVPGTSLLSAIDFSCVKSYWEKKNGKKQGTLYPNTLAAAYQVGPGIRTWDNYKNAVNLLEQQTRSSNGSVQQDALLKFMGIQPGPAPAVLVPIDATTQGVETIWMDRSLRNPQIGQVFCILGRRIGLSSQNKGLPNIPLSSEPIPPTGLAQNVGFISFFDFRLPSVPTDYRIFLQTISKDGFRFAVNRVITDLGTNDNTFSRFTNQSAATFTNLNTAGLLIKKNQPNIITVEWNKATGAHQFQNSVAFKPDTAGGQMSTMTPFYDSQGNINRELGQLTILTQESTAPYIAIEVCKRSAPSTGAYSVNANQVAFQERRLYSRGLELQKNGNPSFFSGASDRSSVPGNVGYVRVNDGDSFVSFSKVAFQALQTITICFRIPQTFQTTMNLFSWVNLERGYTSRIGYTVTILANGSMQIEIKGQQGTTTQIYPSQLQMGSGAPWYLFVMRVDQFQGNTQGVTVVVEACSTLQNTGSFPMNSTMSIAKTYSQPYFFSDYATNAQQRGELRFGGVGALDLAWFHGFDYKIEEGEQIKREARSGWIRTWYESDL
jgi:hypothetical protein